jgi:3-phosphoshikimate 1-carboxyvinyltransferase
MATGESRVLRPLEAEDCRHTLAAVRSLGAEVLRTRGGVVIRSRGWASLEEPAGPLSLGNSGTGFRLLAGLLAGRPFFAILDGDESLRRRPMERIIRPLRTMGAELWGRGGDRLPPLAIRGRELTGIDYVSPVASAQVKSAVLLAGLQAQGTTTLREPSLSRDHTERMLPAFGVTLRREGSVVALEGPQDLAPCRVEVPGDPSSAAFWVVAALIVPGSELALRRVGLNPLRTGFLEVLRRMGGDVSWRVTGEMAGDPVGEIRAAHSPLAGVEIGGEEIPSLIDEIPVLAVAASLASGTTLISGARELRVKESDRIRAVAGMLSAFGVPVEEREDGLEIRGVRSLAGGSVESLGDHRIAMSAAVAGLVARGRTQVRDTENIATSYPGFQRTLTSLATPTGRARRP